MPAPRAVLNDIQRLGLDPTKPHSAMNKSGKLVDESKADIAKPEFVFLKQETKKKSTEVVNKLEKQESQPTKDQDTNLLVAEEKKENEVLEVKQVEETVTKVEEVKTEQTDKSTKKKGLFQKKNVTLNND